MAFKHYLTVLVAVTQLSTHVYAQYGAPDATDGPAADAGAASGAGSDAEEATPTRRTNIMIAHAVFMLLGYMICIPLGILVARYGRAVRTWLPAHRGVMLAATLFALTGFFLAVGGVAYVGDPHFENRHEQLGLALTILVVLQAGLGASTHALRKRYGGRSVVAYVHIPVGLITFGLAVWNVHEAFEVTDWTTPDYASYIIYAWAGLMALLYLVGFYKLRREMEYERTHSDNSSKL